MRKYIETWYDYLDLIRIIHFSEVEVECACQVSDPKFGVLVPSCWANIRSDKLKIAVYNLCTEDCEVHLQC